MWRTTGAKQCIYSTSTVPKLRSYSKITQQASPLLTQFQNDVRLNQALFERIKKITKIKTKNLSPNKKLLEKEYMVLLEMVHY